MLYEVRGLSRDGEMASLVLDAVDGEDARSRGEREGLSVLSVVAVDGLLDQLRRRRAFPLALFSQELLSLLRAGLNLIGSVATLAEKEPQPVVRQVLEAVLASLRRGQTFSDSLEFHPSQFPPLFVATVRASERTGDLPEAMERYLAYHQSIDFVRKKITSALIYPVILMVAGFLVVLFLLLYVVPRFSAIYESGGQDLPFLSRVLLDWGRLVEGHGGVLLAVLSIAVGGFAYGFSRPEFRSALLLRLAKFPSLGERLRIFQLARFYRTLGMLLRAGIPFLRAMEMCVDLLPGHMRGRVQLAMQAVAEGQSVSMAMEGHDLTTAVAARLLRVGEQTGQIGEMMEHIAVFHDEELGRWVEWFTRLFEPLIMAFIGLFIGTIVILMYLPIFELAGSLQ